MAFTQTVVTMRTVFVIGSLTAAAALLLYYQNQLRKRKKDHRNDYKPQRNFKVVLADNSLQPFSHLKRNNSTGTSESHPFYEEIRTLLEASGNVERHRTETALPAMDEDFVWITTKDQLLQLSEILSQESEFAVDTEQHSIRSFLGFTALIQVSTRRHDFLIDAIALHDEISFLRDVFANPHICKVFHGADSDSLWLQRDFHIYIVNLFDTARACDVLGKPQRSLAYLLQTYCGMETNKIFQRADWRLRPLPEEMLVYARTDAHYLLYIADCLRNELLQDASGTGSLYEECLRRSNTLCLQLYEKDAASPATVAASLISRHKAYLGIDENTREGERCKRTVHALCEWRDDLARAEDESPRFVLSEQAILALAKNSCIKMKSVLDSVSKVDEPSPMPDVMQYMTPLPSPSPILLKNMNSLLAVLRNIEKQIDYDSERIKDNHNDIILHFWSLFSSLKKDSLPEELPQKQREHRQGKANSRRAEHRMQRRWRAGDFEACRDRFVKKFSCKAPVYHNCRIYAGDGRLLCFCDRKKLDWYVQRGLAEFLDEDPPAIRLLFEPKGRPEDENNDFYVQSKTNRCVGCGETSHYLRYRVIPSCYRQHFPEHLKSHRSHDIVLLCVDCHEVAHVAAERHKQQVAQDFGIPLFAKRVVDSGTFGGDACEAQVVDGTKGGVSPIQLRTAAMALLRHGSTMPNDRREQLEETIRAYYGGREITKEDIEAALIAGKGPRELRRLSRRKGLEIERLIKVTNENALLTNTKTCLENGNGSEEDLVLLGDVHSTTHENNEGMVASNGCDTNHNESTHQNVIFIAQANTAEVASAELNDEGQIKNVNNSGKLTKAAQRISLLGHGPHGKKVVEKILQEEGEIGIARFCQRWRAVFVEAVKPAYLPHGWDILHSGRREFGEHSIYNPSKRSTNE